MIDRLAYALLAFPSRIRDRLWVAKLRRYCCAAEDAEFTPQTSIHNPFARAAVGIGSRSLFMGEINIITDAAKVRIGDWCFVGPGAKLWAMESIDIGSRVFVSHGVQVFDNNSHSLSAGERHERYRELRTAGRHLTPEAVVHRAIRIEDDVWIGFNSAIMKGVTIGRGAVVGAGSVVTHDVEAYSVVVGNPARVVGQSKT
ncbi:Hexapeptide repeat of succinyl-transferase [Bradyrhizobium lablabi]|uniref:Hexapeptide repeat of succinyl-transferase n=1 Tax=Bradyrhizobium lablabi TaxID=722472 RepID=A0A1M7BGZ3_9BRAD|nr:acyltransferase [Bradyrhizobium lablabi]SHL54193.1 Hexapeptide repeat of succinyl-transferase [Bradyrhizobium lablabi]